MKVLVINAGSSSIKYSLFEEAKVLAQGLAEKIGEAASRINHEKLPGQEGNRRMVQDCKLSDHRVGLEKVVEMLTHPEVGVIRDKSEISAIGHRVVHGGEAFHRPALIDEAMLDAVRKNVPLAPLHNPANLTGIEVARSIFPDAPQVGVFDTAFHQTIPPHAFRYALPNEMYTKLRIRRYGFHGTSHMYVARKAAEMLGKKLDEVNLITLHLGNGASMAAIEKGKSVDTTMGMTPLEGLIMGTRCGDVDPAVHFYLSREAHISLDDMDNLMNKKSGMKGLTGVNDLREITEKAEKGDEAAQLALSMYTYRIKKYIGAYYAVLGTVDALVFTAGVGQNSSVIRSACCQGLGRMGIVIDEARNRAPQKQAREIQAADGDVKVFVIPTDEELEIAQQTREVLNNRK